LTKKSNEDLTRIEDLDLSEFQHDLDQDEDFTSDFEETPPPFDADAGTDPGIELPSDFNTESEFSSEIESETFETDNFATEDFSSSFEDSNDFETSHEFSEEISEEIPELETEKEFEEEPKEEVTEEIAEEIITKTPLPTPEAPVATESPQATITAIKEIQQFSEALTYTNAGQEGNPPFSIIIEDIKYLEDVNDMIIILKEYGILKPEDENTTRESMKRSRYLIPRISEFVAITLCHKLRRFDVNIIMGLTEQINPAKSYESHDRGLITKDNLKQNRNDSITLTPHSLKPEDILATTTAQLDGFNIAKYIDVATASTIVDMHEHIYSNSLENHLIDEAQTQNPETTTQIISGQNKAAATSNPFSDILSEESQNYINEHKVKLEDIYQNLIEKLKISAVKIGANAIVGINFQVIPLSFDEQSKYQVLCNGSLVWVKPLGQR